MYTLDAFCSNDSIGMEVKVRLVVSLGSTRQLRTSESPATASDASCLQQPESVMRDIAAHVSATTQCYSSHDMNMGSYALYRKVCQCAYPVLGHASVHHRESVPIGDYKESTRDLLVCTTMVDKRCHVSGCAGCSPRARALPRQA